MITQITNRDYTTLVQNRFFTTESQRAQRNIFLFVPVQPEQINYPAAELRGIKNLLKNPSPLRDCVAIRVRGKNLT